MRTSLQSGHDRGCITQADEILGSGYRPFSVYRNTHDWRPRRCWHPGVRKRYPVTTLLLKRRVDVYRRDDRAVSAADRHVRAGLNLSASPAAIAHAAFGTARLS